MSPTEARPPLRVALVQFKPTKADVARNIKAVCDIVGAHANQTDLMVFPEAALSGYFLEGGVAEAALTVRTEEALPERHAAVMSNLERARTELDRLQQ